MPTLRDINPDWEATYPDWRDKPFGTGSLASRRRGMLHAMAMVAVIDGVTKSDKACEAYLDEEYRRNSRGHMFCKPSATTFRREMSKIEKEQGKTSGPVRDTLRAKARARTALDELVIGVAE